MFKACHFCKTVVKFYVSNHYKILRFYFVELMILQNLHNAENGIFRTPDNFSERLLFSKLWVD